MTRILIPFVAALTLAGPATAAVFEFDLDFYLMKTDLSDPDPVYRVMGTFTFDDMSNAVSDVAVMSELLGATPPFPYALGSYDSGLSAFTFEARSGIKLSFGVTPADWSGLGVGGMGFSAPTFATERDSSDVVLGEDIDSGFMVTRLPDPDPMPAVPLPAGLPLLLAGLGAFALVRRGGRKG